MNPMMTSNRENPMCSIRLRSLVAVGILLVVGFGFACGDPDDPAGNQSLNVGENHNAGGENDNNGDNHNSGNESIDVEFAIENDTDAPVFVQRATFPSPGWLSVTRSGEPLTIREDICWLPRRCGEEGGVDCGMMPPYAEELPAGEDVGIKWYGAEYTTTQDDNGRCYEERVVDPEHTLRAEFCYGFDIDDEQLDGHIENPTCETVEFTPGSADKVMVTVDEQPPPPPTEPVDFVVQNDTDRPVYVEETTLSPPNWVSVEHEGEPFQIDRNCTQCLCEELNDGLCAVCDAVNTSYAEEIAPADEHRLTWNGTGYRHTSSEEQPCLEEFRFTHEVLKAEICYGFEVEDPICETIDFQLGVDDEVVVVAQD